MCYSTEKIYFRHTTYLYYYKSYAQIARKQRMERGRCYWPACRPIVNEDKESVGSKGKRVRVNDSMRF